MSLIQERRKKILLPFKRKQGTIEMTPQIMIIGRFVGRGTLIHFSFPVKSFISAPTFFQ